MTWIEVMSGVPDDAAGEIGQRGQVGGLQAGTRRGKATHTLTRGHIAWADGDLRAVRGAGQYLKRPAFAPQFAPLARKAELELPTPVAR